MTNELTTDTLRQALARLTALDGVSGHEGAVISYLRQEMAPLADSVEVDAMGNLYAHRAGGNGPHLMVSAHSDEIGALVAAVQSDGFLRLQPVGGAAPAVLAGRKVRVRGYLGVVGLRPGHFRTDDEKRDLTVEDLYVDLGVTSRAAVDRLGILPGDQIVWQSELEATANPDRVVGKAVDNRISCLILLELLRALQGQELPGPLTAVVAVQEEVGLKGARVAAERVRPDAALVVDTVPSADTPDAHMPSFPISLGHGPIFQVSSGRNASGYLMPEPVRDYLIRLATQAGILYQLGAFRFGNTDAGAIYDANGGIPTGVATIPRRYSHSPVEMLDLNDALATLKLCETVVRKVAEFPRAII